MGSADSKCAELLERMGWERPELADDFFNSGLSEYLQYQNLEVVLPRHAPQCDLSMADRKPSMYPRPAFCWEGYKMHLALIGPSTACRNQFTAFLPKIADVFKGPPSRLGPGREAVPHYFIDDVLHRLVLWELPEVNWKQSCEDYIRELGLLYIDCVFMLFSDKYKVTDIYSKMCVAMALHGIPFFVICTMSGDVIDEKNWRMLQCDFQRKDIQVRMFNPHQPHDMLGTLIADFFKEVSWNRSSSDKEITKDLSDDILGQTVRLKNLEKKPELNGRVGVCIGFAKEQSRYRVRIINGGVETDLALKQDCISILKPKLLGCMVRIHGLESRPELNGRFGFVDAFLRDSERYRVFVPDRPGRAMALALKSANLEQVTSVAGARPITEDASDAKPAPPRRTPEVASGKAAAKAPAAPANPAMPKVAPKAAAAASGGHLDPPARDKPASKAAAPAAAGPAEAPPAAASAAKSWRGPAATPTSPSVKAEAAGAAAASAGSPVSASQWQGPSTPASGGGPVATSSARIDQTSAHVDQKDDDDMADFLPKLGAKDEEPDDLMARISAADAEEDEAEGRDRRHEDNGRRAPAWEEEASAAAAGAEAEVQEPEEEEPSVPRLRLSREGLLSLRVWAVVGSSDATEEVVDHLMDSGKTVFTVGSGRDAHFASPGVLREDANIEVLAFVDADGAAAQEAVATVLRLALKGVVLHPGTEAFGAQALQRCRDNDVLVHGADVFSDIVPGTALAVAPLD